MSNTHLLTLICFLGLPFLLIAQKDQQIAPFRFHEIQLQPPTQAKMKTDQQLSAWYIIKFKNGVQKDLLPLEQAYYLGQNTYLLKRKCIPNCSKAPAPPSWKLC